jgi:hypothetical protein
MLNVMKQYNELRDKIYSHVGFVEDWVVFPIEDRTEMAWKINGDEVIFHENESALFSDGDYYTNDIIKHRFYPKSIYKGEDVALIIVDTHVDGNKYFAIYHNDKEVKPIADNPVPEAST